MAYEYNLNPEAEELRNRTEEEAAMPLPEEAGGEIPPQAAPQQDAQAPQTPDAAAVQEDAAADLPQQDAGVLPAEDGSIPVEEDEADRAGEADEEIPIDFEAAEPNDGETAAAPGGIGGAVQQVKNGLQEKYAEARSACKNLMDRISYDLEQTNYNPYIRSTTTYRYEILKKSGDAEPVDVFEFQRSSGYSLRAMAITTLLVAAADVAVTRLLRKKFF